MERDPRRIHVRASPGATATDTAGGRAPRPSRWAYHGGQPDWPAARVRMGALRPVLARVNQLRPVFARVNQLRTVFARVNQLRPVLARANRLLVPYGTVPSVALPAILRTCLSR